MGMGRNFWQDKSLAELQRDLPESQWESLCDGCARCCLHKVEDEETGAVALTCVGCRLLDPESCRCRDYPNRQKRVPGCVRIDAKSSAVMAALPHSCAYRRLSEKQALPDWHPLLSGDADSVHQAGMSMRGRIVGEDDADLDRLEDYAFEEDEDESSLR